MISTAQLAASADAGQVGAGLARIILPMLIFGLGLWLLSRGNSEARQAREQPATHDPATRDQVAADAGRGKRLAGLTMLAVGALLILGALVLAVTG